MARKKVTISSEFAAARELQHRIQKDAEEAGFNAESIFDVKLALEEALINAIKHGNKFDPAKKVQVEWETTPRDIEIIIEDEGPGFERSKVPDPTEECNLEKLTGRGILLMESYMDRVEWSNGGRRVKMIRTRRGEGECAGRTCPR